MQPFDFGGRIAIHPAEALYRVGYSRTLEGAKKTARNLICRNAFPLPLTLVAGHQRVLVLDLLRIAGMDESVVPAAIDQPTPTKRGPGRPRKIDRLQGDQHEQR